jgi:hypothetical protein
MHGVRDRGDGADDPDLPHALAPNRADVAVVLVDLADVGIDGDVVLGKVVLARPRTSSESAWPRVFGRVLERGNLEHDVVLDGGEPAVRVGRQADALDRRRAVPHQREHLLAGQLKLHRPLYRLRSIAVSARA